MKEILDFLLYNISTLLYQVSPTLTHIYISAVMLFLGIVLVVLAFFLVFNLLALGVLIYNIVQDYKQDQALHKGELVVVELKSKSHYKQVNREIGSVREYVSSEPYPGYYKSKDRR